MFKYADGPIVYVNDDEDDQYLFCEVITQLGYKNQVRLFSAGEELLTYLHETGEHPLLILCDINMPSLSGLEVRARIDQSERLRQKSVPFLFFTTEASPAVIKQAYEGRIQGFHTKEASMVSYRQQVQLIISYWQTCRHPYESLR